MLESEPGDKLEAPSRTGAYGAAVADRRNASERRRRKVQGGSPELRMIEYVKAFNTKRQFSSLRDLDGPLKRGVELEEPRALDDAGAGRTPRTGSRDRKRRRVDPLVDGLPSRWNQRYTGHDVRPLGHVVAIEHNGG